MPIGGIPKQLVIHCIRHLENLPEVVINGFPDKNLVLKTIKISRDYVETIMNQKTNCEPLIEAVTKQALEIKKALISKRLKTLVVNRLKAIAKRWGKFEEPFILDNGAESEEEEEEEEEWREGVVLIEGEEVESDEDEEK